MLATSSPDRFLGWAVARAVVHRHKLRDTLIRMVALLMDPLVVANAPAIAGR